MTRNLLAACTLTLALAGVGNAQGAATSPENGAHVTKAQLKQMTREAHTPDQYAALANYYGEQQKSYMQQADKEKREWDRWGVNVEGAFAKYPRPVDSARNLYEYYMYKATESATLQTKYSQLASPNSLVTTQ